MKGEKKSCQKIIFILMLFFFCFRNIRNNIIILQISLSIFKLSGHHPLLIYCFKRWDRGKTSPWLFFAKEKRRTVKIWGLKLFCFQWFLMPLVSDASFIHISDDYTNKYFFLISNTLINWRNVVDKHGHFKSLLWQILLLQREFV